MKEGKFDLAGANYITYKKHSELTSGHLKEDDIVIAVRGSLGALGYVNKANVGWNINSQLAILRTDKSILLGKYLIQFLLSNTGQNQLLIRQTGSALKQLPIGTIRDINVPIISIEEKIFYHLNNLITLHQRKYFCSNNLIFTITTAWEQCKLHEFADKVIEKNIGLQYLETFTNSAEFGIISQKDFFDHSISKIESLEGYYIVKNNNFVYNPRISTTAPVGPINRNKLGRTGVMSPLYTVFEANNVNCTFLEYFFRTNKWHPFMILNGDTGARSDRFSIKDDVFFEMPICKPKIDEQIKIGKYLTKFDDLITLHQRECFFIKKEVQNVKFN